MINQNIKIFYFLVLPILTAACTFKTLYNNLDYLIPEYIVEHMVSLDEVLEEDFEDRTELFINWHRKTQLIQYANWLKTIQQSAGPELTEEQVKLRILEMDEFWHSLTVKLNDEMSNLLPRLSVDQRNELLNSLHNKNETFREEYININEGQRKKHYSDSLVETYETWLGDLTDEQEREIEIAANNQVDTAEIKLKRRMEWQQGVSEILSDKKSVQEKSQSLRTFLSKFEETEPLELQEKSDINQLIFIKLTVSISHSMSKEQMDHFVDKTNDYIRMFTELAENK